MRENPDSQSDHGDVKDKSKNAHGENNERERKHSGEGLHDRVDQRENQPGNGKKPKNVDVFVGDLAKKCDTEPHNDAGKDPAHEESENLLFYHKLILA